MKADYLRYLSEVERSSNKKLEILEKSKSNYRSAFNLAESSLPATDPIRLGLALSFSVFYYEILKIPDEAINLAKNSYESCLKDIQKLSGKSFADSNFLMQMLKEKYEAWDRIELDQAESLMVATSLD